MVRYYLKFNLKQKSTSCFVIWKVEFDSLLNPKEKANATVGMKVTLKREELENRTSVVSGERFYFLLSYLLKKKKSFTRIVSSTLATSMGGPGDIREWAGMSEQQSRYLVQVINANKFCSTSLYGTSMKSCRLLQSADSQTL